mmetsp:Transcript_27656/g.72921  ORF Transcript_27656/g.72921 Transcript_27656/m.72921 type:complete len:117 (-) Transcript_27656:24-374(-)
MLEKKNSTNKVLATADGVETRAVPTSKTRVSPPAVDEGTHLVKTQDIIKVHQCHTLDKPCPRSDEDQTRHCSQKHGIWRQRRMLYNDAAGGLRNLNTRELKLETARVGAVCGTVHA